MESQEFLDAARSSFLKRAKADPSRYYLLDAAKSLAQVQLSIDALIPKLLERVNG
jgi:dTMP kinase